MPAPVLMIPLVPPVMIPLKVVVGLFTASVRTAPKDGAPLKVRSYAPAKVGLPLIVIAFDTVRAAPAASMVAVPSVNVPVPVAPVFPTTRRPALMVSAPEKAAPLAP